MRRPLSTYRLQLNASFGFVQAKQALAYLDALGITDLYCSPYLKAAPGSLHGYDVVDPTALNAELGSEKEYLAFSDEVKARKLGHILDVVSNHMGIGPANHWWWDVLENGPSSIYADYFDIDWNPPKRILHNRVLLPILEKPFSELLDAGAFQLEREGGAFFVRYQERRLPIAPRSLPPLLEDALERSVDKICVPNREELQSLVRALRNLPYSVEPERRLERAGEQRVIQRRIARLCERSREVAAAVDATLQAWNSTRPEAHGIDRLEQLFGEQHYRLSYWRVAAEEINYRRFFDINQLAAMRIEDREVFEATHALILKLLDEGRLTGLRLDHTDGLYDPVEYFRRLRARGAGETEREFYLIAEKIIAWDEKLPSSWQVDGTTGYDFMASVSGLFVDPRGEEPLDKLYRSFTGDLLDFPEHAVRGKRLVMRISLPSEIQTLSQALERLAEGGRRPFDFTLTGLRTALGEVIAAFPVYRTYLRPDGAREPTDERHIERAVALARRHNPEMNASIFDFIRDVLLLRDLPGWSDERRAEQSRFVLRFQQLTPPVMAKGVEDTAFYTYLRLISLNEVGGDPGHFGTTLERFHRQNSERRRRWPLAMIASSTHDNKRGEDVRARISLLSQLPELWERNVRGWADMLAPYKKEVDGAPAPDRRDEYLFYQTLAGAWPFEDALKGVANRELVERLCDYMKKAVNESKRRTSWVNPNETYESALLGFVRAALGDARFRKTFVGFLQRLLRAGAVTGLSQAALKLCSPGVVDTYQGCEQWNLSLVDPDSRRPVDYFQLNDRLSQLRAAAGEEPDRAPLCRALLGRYHDGDVKLYLSYLLLQARKHDPALFLEGDYQPIEAGDDLVCFSRSLESRGMVCAAPRFAARLAGAERWPLGAIWEDRTLELPRAASWRNLFTGRAHSGPRARLADLFADFPVAVLFSTDLER